MPRRPKRLPMRHRRPLPGWGGGSWMPSGNRRWSNCSVFRSPDGDRRPRENYQYRSTMSIQWDFEFNPVGLCVRDPGTGFDG